MVYLVFIWTKPLSLLSLTPNVIDCVVCVYTLMCVLDLVLPYYESTSCYLLHLYYIVHLLTSTCIDTTEAPGDMYTCAQLCTHLLLLV